MGSVNLHEVAVRDFISADKSFAAKSIRGCRIVCSTRAAARSGAGWNSPLMVELNRMFDSPVYRWLPAKSKIATRF
jgi:hypothetical protein